MRLLIAFDPEEFAGAVLHRDSDGPISLGLKNRPDKSGLLRTGETHPR